jgi:hypothetical protein
MIIIIIIINIIIIIIIIIIISRPLFVVEICVSWLNLYV